MPEEALKKMKEVSFPKGTVFKDDLGGVVLKKDMTWEVPADGSPCEVAFEKIKTFVSSEEDLRKKLNALLPYMWRNWVSPYEDNFNGMRDFLMEWFEKEG